MNSKVIIIILNWNGWRDTIECLESLFQINYGNNEIIVVDNASQNDSISKIYDYCNGKIKVESNFVDYNPFNKPIHVIELHELDVEKGENLEKERSFSDIAFDRMITLISNTKNYGFAEGNNIAMRYALNHMNFEYALLLNNDTVVDKDFLSKLVRTGEADRKIGILNPIIYCYDKPHIIQYSGEKINKYTGAISRVKYVPNDSSIIESDLACGACMLIKRSIIDTIGFLPTEYFMFWEDLDYSMNVSEKGYKCVYVPQARIWHKHWNSIGELSYNRIKYSLRSSLIFRKKYFSGSRFFISMTWLFLIEMPIDFIYYCSRAPRISTIKAFLRGISDGLISIHRSSVKR